jgi:hypothetical protein
VNPRADNLSAQSCVDNLSTHSMWGSVVPTSTCGQVVHRRLLISNDVEGTSLHILMRGSVVPALIFTTSRWPTPFQRTRATGSHCIGLPSDDSLLPVACETLLVEINQRGSSHAVYEQ